MAELIHNHYSSSNIVQVGNYLGEHFHHVERHHYYQFLSFRVKKTGRLKHWNAVLFTDKKSSSLRYHFDQVGFRFYLLYHFQNYFYFLNLTYYVCYPKCLAKMTNNVNLGANRVPNMTIFKFKVLFYVHNMIFFVPNMTIMAFNLTVLVPNRTTVA